MPTTWTPLASANANLVFVGGHFQFGHFDPNHFDVRGWQPVHATAALSVVWTRLATAL